MKTLFARHITFILFLFFAINSNANKLISWNELLVKVIKEGHQIENELFDTYYLSRQNQADTSKDYTIDYLSIGARTVDNRVEIIGINASRESWELQNDGSWRIYQWFFYLTTDGQLLDVKHRLVTKDSNGNHNVINIDLTNEDLHKALMTWESIQNDWLSSPSKLN